MVHYIKPDWLEDICKPECPNNLAPLLVEVLATVLDNEVIFKLIKFVLFYKFIDYRKVFVLDQFS